MHPRIQPLVFFQLDNWATKDSMRHQLKTPENRKEHLGTPGFSPVKKCCFHQLRNMVFNNLRDWGIKKYGFHQLRNMSFTNLRDEEILFSFHQLTNLVFTNEEI